LVDLLAPSSLYVLGNTSVFKDINWCEEYVTFFNFSAWPILDWL
jgi:hypothetical protein